MSGPQFFVDHKRGEVNEIRLLLRNPKIIKDAHKQREVIKKVIAYMTLGIDVSKVFSEMIMAANTKDLVQKKMVYHYLCSYASQNPELAILAINTLQKDCRDEDPMVRGLALRSLCSLRVANVAEYVMNPIRTRLNDPSPYVRKTAVTGVAKLYLQDPEAVKSSDLTDVLYNMLKDKDPNVICNCICSLNEILASEGGMVFNQQIIRYLLNRIRDFNEWAQCVVLQMVSQYTPESEEEMYDIMNLLEDRLNVSNSAVVLGTTKVFLNYTKDLPDVHTEVCKRLKAPLLTQMTAGGPEIGYSICGHLKLLIARSPGVFDEDFKSFFCRFNDPPCVKKLKLESLTLLANNTSFSDIMSELSEYVTDVDVDIARTSIRNIGSIAIKIDIAADEAIDHMLSFLDYNMDYVSAESVIVLKDLLRKYPERYEEVIPALRKCLTDIDETEGKLAVIWMMGEYGDAIDDAPYVLEPLIDAFDDEQASEVRLALLTATTKLFFKRPPEMKAMLGRLLKAAIEDVSRVDVRDRALMYYRLLAVDVNEATRVVNCPKIMLESFDSPEDIELREKIFSEFNSLAVTYNTPSEKFVKYVPPEEEDEPEPEEAAVHPPVSPTPAAAIPEPVQPAPAPAEIDILGGFSMSSPVAAAAPGVELDAAPTIDPQTFQSSWGSWPMAKELQLQLQPNVQQATVEQAFASKHILTMASGAPGGIYKFYFYARKSPAPGLFLTECIVDIASGKAVARVKTDQMDSADAFEAIITGVAAQL